MNITTQQDTQAAANKAAEEGGLPTPRAIMDVVDEFGSGTTCYIAEDLRAAIASAIAADRASRQVANKAEVDLSSIHCQEFHELAMDYRGAPAFNGAPEAYRALIAYIEKHVGREVAAQSGQVAVPSGWQLVPIEPTDEMVEESRGFLPVGARHHGPNVYSAMLSAAPSPAKESK